jgi:hypothetical protein
MNTIGAMIRELVGLFIDDGALAAEIVGVVVAAGLSATLVPNGQSVAAGLLLVGCLGVLFASVIRAGRPG